MSLSKKTRLFLLLILILAVLLRLVWLDKYPPSLYSDEANQGYNAYSLLTTGRDEHGAFLPVSLRSFGDWKPPLPTYLMIPSIWLFGLSEISVRIPSAILGIFSVLLVFFLCKEMFKETPGSTKLALLAAFFLSISPWHIFQSRTAMLVITGLFFLSLGIYLFLRGLRDKNFMVFSAISFVLSVYSYYGLRVVAPLIVLLLFIKYRDKLSSLKKELVLSAVIGFILLLPLVLAFLKEPDVVFGRARTVSVFYDQGVNLRKWELIAQDGINTNPFFVRFFHNNFYLYARSITQRFLSHLDGQFLFLTGDRSQPFQIPEMGILNFADLIFIPLGMVFLFKNKCQPRSLILFWIFISIIPAALTFVTPSSNRTFNAVVPYAVLAAVGLAYLGRSKAARMAVAAGITILYAVSFGYFLRAYFVQLPTGHADFWNYGWKEVVAYAQENPLKYDAIIVPDVGMPYIYFLFYEKYPPAEFQKYAVRTFTADRFGFEHVESFGKYLFPTEFDWNFIKKYNLQKNTLYVIPGNQAEAETDYIKAIYYPNGKIAFKMFAYE